MENEKHPIIDTELLNQKLKKQSFIPVQLKEIHNQKKLILENDLESFFDLVKSFNQEHVFYKYGFYKKEDYFIPNHHFEEFPKEYQDAITNHNSELDQKEVEDKSKYTDKDKQKLQENLSTNSHDLSKVNIVEEKPSKQPSSKNEFTAKFKNETSDLSKLNTSNKNLVRSKDFKDSKESAHADKTYEINYRFQFKDNSEKKDKEKELREIIFKDPEFKYCKNQESRYWYLLELLEQDGMEEYRYLAEDPGVYFNGKVKMFMDKTWTIYKEIKNKK